MKSKKEVEGRKIPAESLVRSGVLGEYQEDFARAILGESEYTVTEAKEKLDAVLSVKKGEE